jgi:hypothetical protein
LKERVKMTKARDLVEATTERLAAEKAARRIDAQRGRAAKMAKERAAAAAKDQEIEVERRKVAVEFKAQWSGQTTMGECKRKNAAAAGWPEMTFEFLPGGDMSQIEGLEDLASRNVGVFAFRVLFDRKVFYVAFAKGDHDGATEVGSEAVKRACAAAQQPPTITFLENRDAKTVGGRTLRAMQGMMQGEVLAVMCADSKIWDAATAPLFDSPKITIVTPEGKTHRPFYELAAARASRRVA